MGEFKIIMVFPRTLREMTSSSEDTSCYFTVINLHDRLTKIAGPVSGSDMHVIVSQVKQVAYNGITRRCRGEREGRALTENPSEPQNEKDSPNDNGKRRRIHDEEEARR